jgi:hypothetical protein
MISKRGSLFTALSPFVAGCQLLVAGHALPARNFFLSSSEAILTAGLDFRKDFAKGEDER